MPKQNYPLEFKPAEKHHKDTVLRILLGFAAIALLLAIASVAALQRDGLIDQIIGAYLQPTEPESETAPNTWNYNGEAVFLLAETDDSGALRFVFLVQADAAQRRLLIIPLSPKAKATYEGRELTLEQAQREGGIKFLKAIAAALTGMTADRYICGSDNSFIRAVNTIGSIPVTSDKRVNYRGSDFSLILAQGTQLLQGDALLRYFRYLGTQPDALAQQGVLLKGLLGAYFMPKKAPTPEQLEKQFGTLVNLLQTDISVTDFYACQPLLLALLEPGTTLNIEVME
jgi:hypothetical protein